MEPQLQDALLSHQRSRQTKRIGLRGVARTSLQSSDGQRNLQRRRIVVGHRRIVAFRYLDGRQVERLWNLNVTVPISIHALFVLKSMKCAIQNGRIRAIGVINCYN